MAKEDDQERDATIGLVVTLIFFGVPVFVYWFKKSASSRAWGDMSTVVSGIL